MTVLSYIESTEVSQPSVRSRSLDVEGRDLVAALSEDVLSGLYLKHCFGGGVANQRYMWHRQRRSSVRAIGEHMRIRLVDRRAVHAFQPATLGWRDQR